MASNRWTCNSIDIKSVFLQGKEIDRVVYLTPPPEFEEKDIVCKLNTCIYGLSDASRNWYLCVKEELDKLGVKCSRFEPALFFWHFKNELQGLLITHVDDFCWGGIENFKQIVIEPLRKVFSVGTENVKIFKYLGLDIIQNNKYDISLSQTKFIDEIKKIEITGDRSKQKHLDLNEEEFKSFRALIGQLLWASK